jgi:DNA-binding transcriptional LysR family regulator
MVRMRTEGERTMDRLGPERMFVKVIETGSFAAAAARLGTSSGQASKLVSRLEADMGVKLLNRTTRALSLTEAGQAYAERLRALIEAFDDLSTEVQNAALAPRGRVRLTAPLSFGTIRLSPLLAAFAAQYPDIALDVQFGDRIVSLVDEGFDAAIRVGIPPDSSLTGRKLCSARILAVAAPSYLDARGAPALPADLVDHDCIIDTNFRDPTHWAFKGGVKVSVSGRLSFSNASACLAAAEAGLGIAYIPDFVAGDSVARGHVRTVLSAHENTPLGVFALYPGGRHLPAKVRVLVDFMAAALK